jgi:dipeptidyl aminopeptidase/acylaminoacyl peptidase
MSSIPYRRAANLSPLTFSLGLLAALACGRGPAEPTVEAAGCPRELPRYTVEQFLDTTAYGGASFSPDGSKVLVDSDASGIFNLYALPVAGGDPEQLTHSTVENIRSAGYFPNDERLLYLADEGGNELDHLWVRELDGSVRDLTPGDELRAEFYGWADDDDSFYLGTNERDPQATDVYEYSAVDYSRTLLYRNEEAYSFGDVSPDGTLLALSKNVGNADNDVYVHDLASGETRLLTDVEGDVNYYPVGFAPEGRRLLMLTDLDSEFLYLIEEDLDARTREILRQPNWDVSFAGYSKGGRYLVVGVNADARTELTIVETATGTPVALPDVPNAEISSVAIANDEGAMAFYASSSTRPSDLFVQDLPTGEPRQLTQSLSAQIDPDHLVEAEVARFDSFDGVEIPGILYLPHAASETAKVPALVWVHGGPGGQSRVGYSALIQYLTNHGYAIYAINNRGSGGYGKTFSHMDDRAHGEGDLDDCVAGKDMLAATGVIDPDRIGILGGSYGGYMTLAALTFRPEEFAVGVDLFGISNWHRTVQNIPPWWESFRAYLIEEMGDFDDEEYFRSISPLFHAENIVKPLMVLQGANDPRVLQVESDEIVAAAKANGVPVEYVVFDDEGHGFAKKENRIEGYRAIREFLDRHLAPIGSTSTG